MAWPYAAVTMVWQQQQYSNWCWAAVTSMVSQFYVPTMFNTQCSIASATINHDALLAGGATYDCCDAIVATAHCNETWGLLPPLALVGHLAAMQTGSIGIDSLLSELSAGRPVCVQIAWSGGGGHFIVIDGAFDLVLWPINIKIVWVEDPWYGPGEYAYDTVVGSYQGSGSWQTTFLTCSCVPH